MLSKRLINTDAGGAVVPTSFNTVLYTGNGSTQNVGGVGFQPDFVWIKNRDTAISHALFDVVRGTPLMLRTDLTNEEVDNDNDLQLFTDEGFVVGLNTRVNQSNADMVAWCWKAGGDAVTNTDGTITSQVSANPEAGFSIVSYTVSSASDDGKTVGHGLIEAPKFIIIKNRTLSGDWIVTTTVIDGSYDYLRLNKTDAKGDYTGIAAPTENVFTNTTSNASNVIAYCFAEVAGFSKFGSYVGNANVNGPTVNLGFEPAFIMTKRTDSDTSGGNWLIFDNKRDTVNPNSKVLLPNLSVQELDEYGIDFNPTGFQIKATDTDINGLNKNYIYMAFANQF